MDRSRFGAFEAQLGVMLPEDYRALLLANNGGAVSPADFHISEADGDSTLASFYPLHDGPTWARLAAAFADYSGRIPAWLLPIVEDEGGNAICLWLTGQDRGRIYFWDHEREGESAEAAITPIAPSFGAFCAGTLRVGHRLARWLTPLTSFGASGELTAPQSPCSRCVRFTKATPQPPAGSQSCRPSANGGHTPLRARA